MKLMKAGILLTLVLATLPAQASTFKIATLFPDGSSWMQKMRIGANEINKKTQGRVKFKFYPGGVMGNDKVVIRKIKIGQLQGGALTGGSLSHIFSDNQAYSLILKFRSQKEIEYVRGFVDPLIMQGLEKGGLVSFGLVGSGFSYIMSTKRPVTNVSQLRKLKAWIPSNDEAALEAVKAFKVKPITLPLGDVLAALQTGLINTVAVSPIGAIILQWHTQIKYVTELPVLYSFGTLVLNKKDFKKLTTTDQDIVRSVLGNVVKVVDKQNIKDNQSALAALRNQGITFVQPSAAELKEWQKYANDSEKRMLSANIISHKVIGLINKHLEEFRKGK
ncbi:MAG TPA: C4-dicarboxylate ABC transporter [Acidiferrobacteraceae bacterium]|nr:C4-dicarboxylate ABC transporter [Acidiferrobacteraceae bacterium]